MKHSRSSSARKRTWIISLLFVSQCVITGFIYAFPLYVLKLKTLIGISQVEANVLGVVLYAAVSWIGLPLSTLMIPKLSLLTNTVAVGLSTALGYGLCCAVSKEVFGTGDAAYSIFLLGIMLMMAPLGVWFSLGNMIMTNKEHFGPSGALYVSALLSVAFAIGGVFSGCLYYFSSLDLWQNLLTLTIVQLVAMVPLVTAAWYVSKDSSAKDGTHATDDETQHLQEAQPETPMTWSYFVRNTFTTWAYYHVLLLMLFKVGIGTTFTTNIGTAIQATLEGADAEHVDDRVSLAVIVLNFAQLIGRAGMCFVGLLGGNSHMRTVLSLCGVSLGYILTLSLQIWGPYSYSSTLVYTGMFGVVYGAMWTLSAALLPFLPVQNVVLGLMFTFPMGTFGTFTLNYLSGYLYDQKANPGVISDHDCYGRDCYHMANMMLLGCSIMLLLLSLLRLKLGVPST